MSHRSPVSPFPIQPATAGKTQARQRPPPYSNKRSAAPHNAPHNIAPVRRAQHVACGKGFGKTRGFPGKIRREFYDDGASRAIPRSTLVREGRPRRVSAEKAHLGFAASFFQSLCRLSSPHHPPPTTPPTPPAQPTQSPPPATAHPPSPPSCQYAPAGSAPPPPCPRPPRQTRNTQTPADSAP